MQEEMHGGRGNRSQLLQLLCELILHRKGTRGPPTLPLEPFLPTTAAQRQGDGNCQSRTRVSSCPCTARVKPMKLSENASRPSAPPARLRCPTYRDEGAVPALLGRRAPAVLRAAAARSPLDGLLSAGLGLPVLAGALGLGLQAPLVQREGLLPLQLQPLQRRAFVAALAAVVMLPEELDPPAEPLHHRAVSRGNEIRHHQSGFAVNSQLRFRP